MSGFNSSPLDRKTELMECADVPDHHRASAVRTVASLAHDPDDLTQLLDMLGLDPQEAEQ